MEDRLVNPLLDRIEALERRVAALESEGQENREASDARAEEARGRDDRALLARSARYQAEDDARRLRERVRRLERGY